MDQFVCVRLVRANNLDLSLFQFDSDLSLAIFFMNADKTIYGRYGSRSDFYEAERDISIEGLQKAMRAVLDLHKSYPANKALFAGKRGSKPKYGTLTQYPWIKSRRRGLNQHSCMHCHHLGTAEHMLFRDARKPIPDDVLFRWPMPDVVGLKLDPKEKASVKEVLKNSAAERAGFHTGDEILTLAGQPIISTADVQWVLHNAGERATLKADVLRDGNKRSITLSLQKGWRRKSDISWRPTTGMLRRLALGRMRWEDLSAADRRAAGLGESEMALRIRQSVRRGTPAFRAGFKRGDIIVAVDGHSQRMSESQVLAYSLQEKMPGDRVTITVQRAGKRMKLTLPVE